MQEDWSWIKSELVQGSELPIKYLFASSPMPLTSNVYHNRQSINTISRHDRCDHASSHINSHEPYPALCTLVEYAEGVSWDADELDEWYNNDSLFRSAIATHSDRVIWMDCLEWDVVLNCILSMGIYYWKDTDKQGGRSCPVMSIWYAAVLGNRLLQRIEQGDDKAGLLPKNRGSLLAIHLLLQQDQIESNVYDLVYKVAEAEGAVVKLTEQLASSKAWVAKLEGLVEEQRRTSEDFKEQMSILVSKLLERDSNVEQSFETVEKWLN